MNDAQLYIKYNDEARQELSLSSGSQIRFLTPYSEDKLECFKAVSHNFNSPQFLNLDVLQAGCNEVFNYLRLKNRFDTLINTGCPVCLSIFEFKPYFLIETRNYTSLEEVEILWRNRAFL